MVIHMSRVRSKRPKVGWYYRLRSANPLVNGVVLKISGHMFSNKMEAFIADFGDDVRCIKLTEEHWGCLQPIALHEYEGFLPFQEMKVCRLLSYGSMETILGSGVLQ